MGTLSPISAPPLITFQGRAANQAISERQAGPLLPKKLKDILATDDTPYVTPSIAPFPGQGRISAGLMKYLDQLSLQLRNGELRPRSIKLGQFLRAPRKSWRLHQLNRNLHCELVGRGEFGKVYTINLHGQTYALKVFHRKAGKEAPFVETAIGAYFSSRETKDMSKLYAANPEAGWMLMEYIDGTAPLQDRTGQTIKEQGFYLDDEAPLGEPCSNRIQGIRVDYGGNLWPEQPGKRGLMLDVWDRYIMKNPIPGQLGCPEVDD